MPDALYTLLTPMQQAAAFLDLKAEGEPVTFQTYDDKGKRRELAHILHGTLDSCGAALRAANKRGAGVFWAVNYLDGNGRRAENVTGVRTLVLDLDGASLQPVLVAGAQPHAVVESSPGRYHAYWLVADCPMHMFKPVQQALAARFDGDPSVCDLPRVMRLPGFFHHKGEPFLSRLLSLEATQPYPLAALVDRLRLSLKQGATAAAPAAPAGGGGQVFGEGGRNAALARLAGTLRRGGLSPDAMEAALLKTNAERCRPPLPDDEVRGIASSIGRYPAGAITATPAASPAPAAPPTWLEPLLPGQATVPEIEPELLGGVMGRMAAAVAASTQTPPAMAVLTLLGILAALLQRRFKVRPYGAADDYTEPLPLWITVLLGSGNRKSAVHTALTGVCDDWCKREGDRLRRDIAQVAAQREVDLKRIETLKAQAGKEDDATARQRLQDEIARLKDEMPAEMFAPRLWTGDITPERAQQMLVEQDGRIALLSDEGGAFNAILGGYSGGASSLDVWLQGYAGTDIRVDRASRTAHIKDPAVTLTLAFQPGILADLGKARRLRDSGFMARILFAVPRSTVGTRDVRDRRPVPDDVRHEYEQRVLDLLAGQQRPMGAARVLSFDADATEHWLGLCERIERQQGDGGRYAHLVDWTSKLPGATARIAALLALADEGTGIQTIGIEPVRRAVALAEKLIPHAEAAFALMGAADGESDAQAVLAYIQRHQLQTVVRHELHKAMEGRFRKVAPLLEAIKLLQEWRVLGPERRTAGVGRPSVYYEVNPRLFVEKSIS